MYSLSPEYLAKLRVRMRLLAQYSSAARAHPVPVRNLVRREGSSFFLLEANGQFYPDFLCQLLGINGQLGPVLAMEYKGGNGWTDAEDDRLIGGIWANLSAGRCRFVMVKEKRWDWIEGHLN